ncbi:carbohydrate ABC transporter permease [Tumebacillus sp. ITR2]|uniref:Carbohydrate ABC transporter permease n=1 Tax=Tumebacillus amylolyticus TaxID=2801339 RepID=A0ABS1J545_9BACL|nr:carbohydrate ABC transporter permease [Tumebacillus amylolyticus]MBL0385392.1 carbohydrate ABC transporter permease [Tumebacillus amylolyticus]
MKKILRILFYCVVIGYAVLTLIPFLWSVLTSLKSTPDMDKFWVPVSSLTFENYSYIITKFPFFRWLINSAIVAGAVTVGNLLFNTLAGYALARIKFPGRGLIFYIVLAVMMVPGQVVMIPVYIMLANWGWINTYQGFIIPFLTSSFGIFMMRQFFLALPVDLEEAALIDGLSRWGIFFKIALPLAKPALAAQTIFMFLGNWNSFMWPSLLASSDDMYTLPVGLNSFHWQYVAYWNQDLAGTMFMTVPMLIVFLLFQKWFIKGIATSGLK